jgi:hypothetical protein
VLMLVINYAIGDVVPAIREKLGVLDTTVCVQLFVVHKSNNILKTNKYLVELNIVSWSVISSDFLHQYH